MTRTIAGEEVDFYTHLAAEEYLRGTYVYDLYRQGGLTKLGEGFADLLAHDPKYDLDELEEVLQRQKEASLKRCGRATRNQTLAFERARLAVVHRAQELRTPEEDEEGPRYQVAGPVVSDYGVFTTRDEAEECLEAVEEANPDRDGFTILEVA